VTTITACDLSVVVEKLFANKINILDSVSHFFCILMILAEMSISRVDLDWTRSGFDGFYSIWIGSGVAFNFLSVILQIKFGNNVFDASCAN